MNAIRPLQPGLFVVSLDFELAWGIRHLPWMHSYMPNLIGARSAVRSLLTTFKEYEIHATWAVVGFLFADSGATLRQHLPALQPQYVDPKLSPYLALPPEDSRESNDSVFFAPSLIRQIASVPNQEIGTHTLSHYYCLEPGQDVETFRADLMAARSLAHQFGIDLKSLVFPKNQCRPEFLNVCREVGIIAYRGTPSSWPYLAAPEDENQKPLRRLARLLDDYLPISSVVNKPVPLTSKELPIDVPASRFLRAYAPQLRLFERLRLARIKNEMTFAAKSGRLYHLWWHPHNFGVNTELNLRFLRHVLDHYRALHTVYGMESANIRETVQESLSSTHRGAFDRTTERRPMNHNRMRDEAEVITD
jgi:peptidoglycan/xylan/chitin deacetylase (PgdA/CDA1 family)